MEKRKDLCERSYPKNRFQFYFFWIEVTFENGNNINMIYGLVCVIGEEDSKIAYRHRLYLLLQFLEI